MLPSEGYEKAASNKSPFTITIAEMLNGIKDRNDVPYVVNGKPLILKVSAGLAVKVALTCRTTFC